MCSAGPAVIKSHHHPCLLFTSAQKLLRRHPRWRAGNKQTALFSAFNNQPTSFLDSRSEREPGGRWQRAPNAAGLKENADPGYPRQLLAQLDRTEEGVGASAP